MAARLDNIASYLRQQKSPLDAAMMQRSLAGGSTMVKSQDAVSPSMYGSIPDVGQFNTPGSLPTDSSPVEPDILMGNYPTAGPNIGPTRNDIWTRMDPNMGYINPSLTIDPSVGGSPNNFAGGNAGGGINFDSGGVLQGGNRGPQGTVYGTDPNTGQPIYNVTGSPRPGFFDSKTGKVTEAIGAGALNFFVPGLGFVSKAIFDAVRRGNDKRNTGTDLTGRNQPPASPANNADPAAAFGPPSVPPGGALFGFNPAQGGGTPQFDFTTGTYKSNPSNNPLYTTGGAWSPVAGAGTDLRFAQQSGTGNFTADKTTNDFLAAGGYKGTPNRAVAPDSGRNRFSTGTGFMGGINADTGLLQRMATPTVNPFVGTQGGPALTANPSSAPGFNAGLAQQPGYQAYLQRLAAMNRGG